MLDFRLWLILRFGDRSKSSFRRRQWGFFDRVVLDFIHTNKRQIFLEKLKANRLVNLDLLTCRVALTGNEEVF